MVQFNKKESISLFNQFCDYLDNTPSDIGLIFAYENCSEQNYSVFYNDGSTEWTISTALQHLCTVSHQGSMQSDCNAVPGIVKAIQADILPKINILTEHIAEKIKTDNSADIENLNYQLNILNDLSDLLQLDKYTFLIQPQLKTIDNYKQYNDYVYRLKLALLQVNKTFAYTGIANSLENLMKFMSNLIFINNSISVFSSDELKTFVDNMFDGDINIFINSINKNVSDFDERLKFEALENTDNNVDRKNVDNRISALTNMLQSDKIIAKHIETFTLITSYYSYSYQSKFYNTNLKFDICHKDAFVCYNYGLAIANLEKRAFNAHPDKRNRANVSRSIPANYNPDLVCGGTNFGFFDYRVDKININQFASLINLFQQNIITFESVQAYLNDCLNVNRHHIINMFNIISNIVYGKDKSYSKLMTDMLDNLSDDINNNMRNKLKFKYILSQAKSSFFDYNSDMTVYDYYTLENAANDTNYISTHMYNTVTFCFDYNGRLTMQTKGTLRNIIVNFFNKIGGKCPIIMFDDINDKGKSIKTAFANMCQLKFPHQKMDVFGTTEFDISVGNSIKSLMA